jgi:anti-sigma factor RsiW
MTKKISSHDLEALSAYLDGQLPRRERLRLEASLRAREELRDALEELRRTRTVVRAGSPLRAPRNFTLTPAMAGIQARYRPQKQLFPAMRLASAFSSLMFVLLVLGEVFLGSQRLSARMISAEPMQFAAPAEGESAAAPAPALEMQAQEAALPSAEVTAEAVAKMAPLPTPTPAPPSLSQPIAPVEESSIPPYAEKGVGGGGGAGDETQDQAALSSMAPSVTATPLPTMTPTPTVTVAPSATAELGFVQAADQQNRLREIPGSLIWRTVEILLALMGISTGLIAFYLYRTGRA